MTIRKVERAAPAVLKTLDDEVKAAQNLVHLATAKASIFRYIESLFVNREMVVTPSYFFRGPSPSKDSGTLTFKSTAPTEDLEKIGSRIEKQVGLSKLIGSKPQVGQVSPSVTARFAFINNDTFVVNDFKVTSY